MVVTASPRIAARFGAIRLLLLLVCLALTAHDAVYALQHGLEHAIRGTSDGHHDHWPLLSALAAVAAAVLVGTGLLQIAQLTRAAGRRAGASPTTREDTVVDSVRGYLRDLAALWARLSLLAPAVFLLQENAEALAVDGRLVGLDPMLAAHPLAIPALVGLSLVLASLAAAFRWRVRVLEARVREARPALPRPALRDAVPATWSSEAGVLHLFRIERRCVAPRPPPLAALP